MEVLLHNIHVWFYDVIIASFKLIDTCVFNKRNYDDGSV
jgi:hypothetical protein